MAARWRRCEPQIEADSSARGAARARGAAEHRDRRRASRSPTGRSRVWIAWWRASPAASRGVDFDSIDGQSTNHHLFMLVVPEHSGGKYLKALARISRFFRDRGRSARASQRGRGRSGRRPERDRGRRREALSLRPCGRAMERTVSDVREIQAHGALIDVLGVGVLLMGPSGVGKSECALELVSPRTSPGGRRRGPELERRGRLRPVTGDARRSAFATIMEIRGLRAFSSCRISSAQTSVVERMARWICVCHLDPPDTRARTTSAWALERDETQRRGRGRCPALTVLPLRPAGSIATVVEVAVPDDLLLRRKPVRNAPAHTGRAHYAH